MPFFIAENQPELFFDWKQRHYLKYGKTCLILMFLFWPQSIVRHDKVVRKRVVLMKKTATKTTTTATAALAAVSEPLYFDTHNVCLHQNIMWVQQKTKRKKAHWWWKKSGCHKWMNYVNVWFLFCFVLWLLTSFSPLFWMKLISESVQLQSHRNLIRNHQFSCLPKIEAKNVPLSV